MARGKVTRAETQSRRGVMKPSGVAWLGDIPEGWETLRNKWCFSCSKSIVGKASETAQLLSLTTSGVKCKGKEVLGGKLPESFDTYQEVSQNDLILCLFDMDCSAVFSGLSRFDGMISPAYKVVKCKSCIEPKYADYWFKFVGSQRFFKHYAKNIRYSLTFDEFAELMMIVPPLPEQRAIADYLDEKCGAIDAAVAEAKKGIEEYKAWKKSLIFEVVTGKRRVGFFNAEKQSSRVAEKMKSSGIPWIGTIPEGWAMVKASKIFSVITDFVASGSFADLRENVKYLDYPDYAQLIRTADVSGKSHELKPVYISKESYDFLSGSNLYGGELLLPNIGASVGDVYIVPRLYERMSLAPNAIMVKNSFCDKFYFYFFSCDSGRLALEDIAESTAQPKFNKTDFRNLRLPAPATEEQQAIANYLDEKCAAIDAMVAEKEALIADLEAYKKSLIYETVTGKRR